MSVCFTPVGRVWVPGAVCRVRCHYGCVMPVMAVHLPWSGEIRGQLTLYSASVYLSSYQLPTPIQSTATGVGAVVISSWSSLTVSLSLNGVVSQTGASLMSGGAYNPETDRHVFR